jgi:hypothetical protein
MPRFQSRLGGAALPKLRSGSGREEKKNIKIKRYRMSRKGVLREKDCWLVAGGWFVLRQKYCWLVADKPSEQA